MKTSIQWWDEVKIDSVKMEDWLKKQWRGEVTAAHRIRRLANQFNIDSHAEMVLSTIAAQEEIHAEWIRELLETRNITVDATELNQAESRYWAETLPGIKDFHTGAAVAAHAEGMRLERIRAIAGDNSSPVDIKIVFERILADEEWHERAFRELSSNEALIGTRGNHELGLSALGLTH